MTTKRDIENAWKVHDHTDNPDCDKKPGWNDNLGGHSRFNPGCMAWVKEFAEKYPVKPPAMPIQEEPKPSVETRPSGVLRHECAGCGKLRREDRMQQLIMEDRDSQENVLQRYEGWVCGKKCARIAARKVSKDKPSMAPVPTTIPKEPETIEPTDVIEKNMTCPTCAWTYKKINGRWVVYDSDGKFHHIDTTNIDSFEMGRCPLHGLIETPPANSLK